MSDREETLSKKCQSMAGNISKAMQDNCKGHNIPINAGQLFRIRGLLRNNVIRIVIWLV